ncbi:MAG: RNA polymerase subunit sigma-70, partial [Mycobacteriales bacterium]
RGNTAVPGAAGGRAAVHEADRARQREVVDAFLAAAREGDFGALVAILDPDVLLRADGGPTAESATVRGARAVAGQALRFARLARYARPAMVNGSVGLVVAPEGVPVAVMGIAVRDGRVLELDILADITRLRGLDLTLLDD